MMITLPFEDFSRFIRRTDRIKVYNTVNVVVDEVVIRVDSAQPVDGLSVE